ncbi:hypothetical protein AK830_g5617 [Neonectria ditissima]|uniref:Uncharacterized protein n=1 Tax=Neonectria ditissima TaxID=78410 RepID=A0A0P7B4K8_9HYPO|nr:hypothetical protein AK830_g5617 [Neonectria ditissima]
MLPCESIKLILLSVESLKPTLPQPSGLGRRRKNVPYENASVLHISNSAKYSFITEKFLLKLLRANYGSQFSSFKIDNDSIAHLQWHYPNLRHMETTTHLVVRDSRFQIILRKEDWERPIRHWLTKDYSQEQLRERGIIRPRLKDSQSHQAESIKSKVERGSITQAPGMELGVDSETNSVASGSTSELSRAGTATTVATVAACPGRDGCAQVEEHGKGHREGQQVAQDEEKANDPTSNPNHEGSVGDEDEDEEGTEVKSEHHEECDDESQWANIKIVDRDSEGDDVDSETDEDAYWRWSPEKQQWFHQNDDKSLMWFPRLA